MLGHEGQGRPVLCERGVAGWQPLPVLGAVRVEVAAHQRAIIRCEPAPTPGPSELHAGEPASHQAAAVVVRRLCAGMTLLAQVACQRVRCRGAAIPAAGAATAAAKCSRMLGSRERQWAPQGYASSREKREWCCLDHSPARELQYTLVAAPHHRATPHLPPPDCQSRPQL